MRADETLTQGRDHATILADALRVTPGVDGWQTAVTRREEAQLYLIGAREEARRIVADERASVTVHNLHAPHAEAEGAGQALGMTTFTALPGELADPAALSARLREGALMASLTDNQPFTLPGEPREGYPRVETSDPELAGDMTQALERAARQLQAALARSPGLRMGSAELFATRAHETLRTSAGVSATQASTSVFFDLILLAGEGSQAAEFHAELRRRRLRDLHFERIVAAYGAFALHSLNAAAPSSWRGPVILSGEAAAQLFNTPFFQASPFAAHCSAQLKHQRMSRFTPGELMTPEAPRGDALTLISDPTRPWGTRTASFDRHGLPATRVTLIEDGVFRNYWADARYASYLGVAPTGDIGNLTVRTGTTPARALRDTSAGPVYEVVAFSFFNPDTVTGDFSAEIRLGYRHDASGVTPIKGGALVGNVFGAFGDARFSAEPYTDGTYYGPAAIRFGELTIAGE
ncbi:MAG TPA: metallopeptidase TldD-related protein [Ktedonobacterales bacterium]|nr:metallopeptidase TldD-related protein [Ktedonobacterales bacterium]